MPKTKTQFYQELLAGVLMVVGLGGLMLGQYLPVQLLGLVMMGIGCVSAPRVSLVAMMLAVLLGEMGRIEILGWSFLILDITAVLVVLSASWRWLLGDVVADIYGGVGWWFAGFFLAALVSLVVNAPVLDTSIFLRGIIYLLRIAVYGSLFFAVPVIIETEKERAWFFWLVVLMGTIFALLGFVQLTYFSDFHELGLDKLGWDPHESRLTSTWLDPNYAGYLLSAVLAMVVAHILQIPRGRVLLSLLAVVLAGALFFTFSRSAYLACAVMFAIMAVLRARWLIPIGIAALVLLLLFGGRASERVWEMGNSFLALGGSEETVVDETARLRLESWQEGWELVVQNPIFGVGYGVYADAQWKQGNLKDLGAHYANGSDSSLLNVWAMTGTVGLLVFLGVGGSMLWGAWCASRAGKKEEYENILIVLVPVLLLGVIVHSFFVNSLFFPLILAVIIPINSLGLREAQERRAHEA